MAASCGVAPEIESDSHVFGGMGRPSLYRQAKGVNAAYDNHKVRFMCFARFCSTVVIVSFVTGKQAGILLKVVLFYIYHHPCE